MSEKMPPPEDPGGEFISHGETVPVDQIRQGIPDQLNALEETRREDKFTSTKELRHLKLVSKDGILLVPEDIDVRWEQHDEPSKVMMFLKKDKWKIAIPVFTTAALAATLVYKNRKH